MLQTTLILIFGAGVLFSVTFITKQKYNFASLYSKMFGKHLERSLWELFCMQAAAWLLRP